MKPKYKVIYADCPWDYDDKNCNGAIGSHYAALPVTTLSALPVGVIADRDAVLFLWATYPFLKEAIQVGESWGFKYKTIAFQWVKLNRKALTPFYGLGRWTRGNTEPCLLFTKGKPRRDDNSVSQLVFLPRLDHSQKPLEVADQIVRLVGDVPRLELFATSQTDGWDCIGNAINGEDIRVSLARIIAEQEGDR